MTNIAFFVPKKWTNNWILLAKEAERSLTESKLSLNKIGPVLERALHEQIPVLDYNTIPTYYLRY